MYRKTALENVLSQNDVLSTLLSCAFFLYAVVCYDRAYKVIFALGYKLYFTVCVKEQKTIHS